MTALETTTTTNPVSLKRWPRSWAALAVACAAFVGVGLVRPGLADRLSHVREVSDSYPLPPPEQVVLMSLGYRAAVADLIYAHVLVAHGLYFSKKRRFEHVDKYLETITTLDPKFVQPYLYADTLIIFQPELPRDEHYERAREFLIKGTQEFPYHQQIWFTAGQYLAYLAPPNMKNKVLAARFKQEGAKLLSRACELASNNQNIPYHCIAAASLLNQAGHREALIQMLTRTLAVNDDEEIREKALSALSRWVSEQAGEEYEARLENFQRAWREDLPFLPKEQLLLLGPRVNAAACAGVTSSDDCVYTWRDWARLQNR